MVDDHGIRYREYTRRPHPNPNPTRTLTPPTLPPPLQTPTHQQVGSDPLLEAFLTAAVMDVFRNSTMFGGVLVALTATLISDVANQDPSTTVAYLLRHVVMWC